MAAALGIQNPFRYRGYVYDQETGLYYLQSRYYDPELGRFISADDVAYLGADGDFGSFNLFAYCGNNPVNRTDPDGTDWQDVFVVGVIVVAVGLIILATVSTGGALILASAGGAAVSGTATTAVAVKVGTTMICTGATVAGESIIYAAASKSKDNVDPYRRPGQKKQGRENKNKSRRSENFKSRNNRRDNKPSPPKHHTPSNDHRKSFSTFNEEK